MAKGGKKSKRTESETKPRTFQLASTLCVSVAGFAVYYARFAVYKRAPPVRSAASRTHPRVYVHELPAAYNFDLAQGLLIHAPTARIYSEWCHCFGYCCHCSGHYCVVTVVLTAVPLYWCYCSHAVLTVVPLWLWWCHCVVLCHYGATQVGIVVTVVGNCCHSEVTVAVLLSL